MLIDHLQAALQIRDHPVLQLGHAVQVAFTARGFQLLTGLLDLLLDLCRTLHFGFFRRPDFLEIRILAFKTDDFFLKFFQAFFRRLVLFLLKRLGFDFQLNQATIQAVEHFRLGVNFHTNAAGRFVDKVDGLVRQLAIGDIAMAQLGRRNDRAVSDRHLMVDLIAFFEATQDGDGVFFARLFHQHFLEATLKCRVLLNVLAVLVERGCANAVQLAPRQGRLEHVAGVHRTFAFTGANHGVQFVDKQNDLPFLLRQLVQQGFQAFFELATELGTGDQRPHVQGQQALAFQAIRHLTINDALGQALGNRGFTHAGFADQHRVVLGTTLQHLDGATNFVVTADHRVKLAFFGALGQVDGVLVQRLARLFVVGVIHGLATTQVVDGVFQGFLAHALPQQQFAKLAVVVHCGEQHQFAGDELITFLLSQAISLVEQARQVLRHVHVAGRVLDFRQLVELFAQLLAQAVDVKAHLHQQGLDRTTLLFKERLHQVRRLDGRVVKAHRQGLGIR